MNKNKTLEMLTSISKIKAWLIENKSFSIFAAAFLVLLVVESLFHTRIVFVVEKTVSKLIEEKSIPLIYRSVDYGYLPPRLILNDAVYSGGVNNVEVEKASISVKIIPLVKLKIVPSTLYLLKPDVRWSLDLNETEEKKPLELSFSKLMEIFPLYRVSIEEGDLYLENKDSNIQLRELNLDIIKSSRSIKLNLGSVAEIEHKDYYENISVNLNTNLDEDSIYIKFLNLQKDNSILKVSGSIKTKEVFDQKKSLSISTVYEKLNELSLNTKINLNDFNETLRVLLKTEKNFKGEIQATGYFNQENPEQKSSITFAANDLSLPRLKLKSARISANIAPDGLFIKEDSSFSFKKGSKITIKSAKIEKNNESYWTTFSLKSKTFLLEDLLHSISVPNKSFHSPITTDSECKGSISPTLALSCKGDISISKFVLTLRDSAFLDLKSLSTKFKVSVGIKELSFTANPIYKNSFGDKFTGDVSGNIHYRDGFLIDYNSSAFDLEFLNVVANQKLSGVISAKGQTQGSSRWGKFFVDINQGENLIYNDFYLGSAKAKIKYEYPNLEVENVTGFITDQDDYTADFILNTDADSMRLSVNGTDFTNSTVSKIFKSSFDFPEGVEFSNANFRLTLGGEPNIDTADLSLNAKLPILNVFGESFKESNIGLKGKKGVWLFENTYFKKKNSSFTSQGQVVGFKEIDLTLKSLDLDLNEIDNLQRKGLKISGPAVFRLDAKGPIGGPKAFGRVQLKSTKGIRESELGNSEIGFRILENQINFKGEAFGQRIIGDGVYPLNQDGDLGFNGSVNNLDLFQILEFKFDDSSIHYLPMSFDSDVRLSFNNDAPIIKGWLDNLNIEFKNANENILKFKNYETIQFEKGDSALSIISAGDYKAEMFIKALNSKSVEVKVNGLLEAHALQSFIPKTEILRGLLDIDDVTIVLNSDSFNHNGLIKFSNGTFKNESFPYSFTDLNTQLELSGNKVSFNKINARINNNPVTASGFITTLPLALDTSIQYTGLQIEYPEEITSLSDGELKVSGSSLPLKAEGRVRVVKGEFRKDLLSGADGKTITANKFLPKEILYKNAPPFNLNILLEIDDNYAVKTSEINGFAKGQLKLDGNAFNPVTKGRIELRRGMTINFLDKVFAVQEGRLNYRESYIDNPDLYIDAATEVTDNNDITSNKYLIRMLVEGSADNLKFSFNSKPSLAEKEIISLLTLGTVSTQSIGQEINTQQQATHSGLQVGSFLLQKNKGVQELQKKTGTEIGISSSVDAFNVNPKVQLKKKWSPKLSSTVSQSFGNQQVLSLSTEYKVNQNVSTSFTIQNNQTQDATQLLNRQVQQGEIFGVDLQYKFEFD